MATGKPSSEGQPGEPGQPGQQGQDGGGIGGKGGMGGRGGRVSYRRLTLFVIVVATVLSIGTLLLVHHVDTNGDQIRKLEQQNGNRTKLVALALFKANEQQNAAIALIRQAEYRICLRQQVVRAAVNADQDHDEPTLPLYDCTPDLTGGQATRLNTKQTAAFAARVKRNRYTP